MNIGCIAAEIGKYLTWKMKIMFSGSDKQPHIIMFNDKSHPLHFTSQPISGTK